MARQLARLGQLDIKKTLFLLCDIQDKFKPGMKLFDQMVNNSKKLVAASKHLDVPLIVSEHYPEKLGRIVKDLDVSHAKMIYGKTLFSMATPEMRNKVKELFPGDLESIVLFGLESHICLEQTAVDMCDMGYQVHIAADCAMSRSLEDRAIALQRLREIGCHITTSESIIFKLMKDKNHPKFNEVRKLVTFPSEDTGLSKL
uniref:Isochorismatase domain-containing protein 1 n=1 Tax=Nyssomyia neivai TaxID=330878 RepID=A0A1L8DXZ4_9DIPT